MKPMHVCRYVISECNTMPGTLTNVTADMLAPIIPNDTTYHGEFLPPLKNVALLLLLAVK